MHPRHHVCNVSFKEGIRKTTDINSAGVDFFRLEYRSHVCPNMPPHCLKLKYSVVVNIRKSGV